ncbi:MAG: hypothetical protein NVSMB46_00080 [Candidatus Saccharimonadales bacterium]
MLAKNKKNSTVHLMEFQKDDETLFSQLLQQQKPDQLIAIEMFHDIDHARVFTNWCLAGDLSDKAVADWWITPREALDGKTPEDVWPEKASQCIKLASYLLV